MYKPLPFTLFFVLFLNQIVNGSSWKFKNGDGFTIGLPSPRYPCKCRLQCFLILPDKKKMSMDDFGNGPLTSFEFLPGRGGTCSFRIFPKELDELYRRSGQKYLGQYWTIVMEYERKGRMMREVFYFYMNTMSWLDEKGYNAVEVSHRVWGLSQYSNVKYYFN